MQRAPKNLAISIRRDSNEDAERVRRKLNPSSNTKMATRTAPVTPVTPSAQRQQQPATPTGAWKHPKFDEITRRQYATTFDERNVRTILVNGAILAASFFALSIAYVLPFVQ